MATNIKAVLLLSAILAGCATHQVTEQAVAPKTVTPFATMLVQLVPAAPETGRLARRCK